MTLIWHQSGPLMRYDSGMLEVQDLNPEVRTKWAMSRMQMLRLGWRCVVAALSRC